MKILTTLIAFFFVATVQAAEQPVPVIYSPSPAASAPEIKRAAKFDLSSSSVSEVIRLAYMEVFKQPYVIDPAVMQDQRLVAFRFDSAKGNMRQFWIAFLDGLGYELETRSGVDFVKPKPAAAKAPSEVYIYRPRFRDVSYLADLLSPLVGGSFTSNRQIPLAPDQRSDKPASPTSAAGMLDKAGQDTLIFQGSQQDVERLKKILPQVDTPTGEVVVRGVVYEVTTGQKEGSAFNLALSVLGGKLSLGLNTATNPADSFISFKNSTIDAVFSALSGDNRFKVVTNPRLRIQSGKSAHLAVGQDVPTLSSVSYPSGGGTPVQSVEYRSSGVIFDLTPTVRDGQIDMNVRQQISDFAKTETGVNNSPTLTKRELSTSVSLDDGEIILLGGLQQTKDQAQRQGFSFLPRVLDSATSDKSNTEILLLLQVNKIEKHQ